MKLTSSDGELADIPPGAGRGCLSRAPAGCRELQGAAVLLVVRLLGPGEDISAALWGNGESHRQRSLL